MWGIVDLVVDEPFDRQLIGGLLDNSKASSIDLPLIISVAIELLAIAEPHPNVLNFTSSMIPSFTLMYIFMMSPHFALPTSPIPSASSIFPKFLGLRK